MVQRFAQLRYAIRRHRLGGLTRLMAHNAAHHIRRFARLCSRPPPLDAFDQENGTDTAGNRNVASLDVIASPAAPFAAHYEPSSAEVVRRELEKLSIDPAGFTFVDFGSGKGRVLLVAALFPFEEVIGIEFSRELHETALRNIACLLPELTRAGNVRSIHCEASAFELPDSDLVCYFNNPFGPPIIGKVFERLIAHHRDQGRQIIVIYVDPQHREVFKNSGTLEIVDETSDILILTTLRRAHRSP